MKILLSALLLLPILLNAQPERKCSIGLIGSINGCYRTLSTDDKTYYQHIVDDRNDREELKIGYSFGFGIQWKINKPLSIETGLTFNDRGMKDQSNGTFNLSTFEMRHNYHYFYLDVPVKLNYTALRFGKINVYTTAGISCNFLIKAKEDYHTEFSDGRVVKGSVDITGLELLRKVGLGATAGVGIKYQLTNHLSLRLQPEFYYSISSLYSAALTEHLYSIGLNGGAFLTL